MTTTMNKILCYLMDSVKTAINKTIILYWKGAGQFVPTQRDATRRMNTFLQLSQKGVSKVSERVRGWRKRAKCAEQSGALQSE